MADLRISQIAELTGLSMRYWQRKAMAGEIEGARYFDTGNRRIYLVDRERFTEWWNKQLREIPCRKISGNAEMSGGSASQKTAKPMKVLLKRGASVSLKSVLRESVKS